MEWCDSFMTPETKDGNQNKPGAILLVAANKVLVHRSISNLERLNNHHAGSLIFAISEAGRSELCRKEREETSEAVLAFALPYVHRTVPFSPHVKSMFGPLVQAELQTNDASRMFICSNQTVNKGLSWSCSPSTPQTSSPDITNTGSWHR